MNVFVTGANGFVGRELVRQLLNVGRFTVRGASSGKEIRLGPHSLKCEADAP